MIESGDCSDHMVTLFIDVHLFFGFDGFEWNSDFYVFTLRGFIVSAFLCGVFILALCLSGFSPGTPASSNGIKTCKVGVRLIDYSKLPVGVNVTVDGCLSLYMQPVMN